MSVTMKANRIHVFGGPEVILFEDAPCPTPGTGEVLVRVYAAGVGRWDAWIRASRRARNHLYNPKIRQCGRVIPGSESHGPGIGRRKAPAAPRVSGGH